MFRLHGQNEAVQCPSVRSKEIFGLWVVAICSVPWQMDAAGFGSRLCGPNRALTNVALACGQYLFVKVSIIRKLSFTVTECYPPCSTSCGNIVHDSHDEARASRGEISSSFKCMKLFLLVYSYESSFGSGHEQRHFCNARMRQCAEANVENRGHFVGN